MLHLKNMNLFLADHSQVLTMFGKKFTAVFLLIENLNQIVYRGFALLFTKKYMNSMY